MSIALTKKAEDKVKEILSEQPEPYAGLRIQVVGGGCSGFQYRMCSAINFRIGDIGTRSTSPENFTGWAAGGAGAAGPFCCAAPCSM